MYKSVAEEWEQSPWQNFGWFDIETCLDGFEPILAVQELGGVKIESKDMFKGYGAYLCGKRASLDLY